MFTDAIVTLKSYINKVALENISHKIDKEKLALGVLAVLRR
ncbi:MAG: hypothetical protein V4714_22900 [Bacteroidota bacterium]